MNSLLMITLITALLPLVGTIAAGLFGHVLGRTWTHRTRRCVV